MKKYLKLIPLLIAIVVVCLIAIKCTNENVKNDEVVTKKETVVIEETKAETKTESKVETEETESEEVDNIVEDENICDTYTPESTYHNDDNDVYEEPEIEEDYTQNDSNTSGYNLGTFKLTAYCNCYQCCGQWAGGATASGTMPTANNTIAVDTSVIPFGTKVVINGTTYTAEDTGSAIKGNKIDIYFDSHQEALNFGVQYADVYQLGY